MRKNRIIKLLALVIISSVIITGCSVTEKLGGLKKLGGGIKDIGKGVAKYPLVDPLTEKEVIDYYKEALDFDTIASRNVDVQQIVYETKEVDGNKARELERIALQIENILKEDKYRVDQEVMNLISEETFNYIKAVLDDKVAKDGEVVEVSEALGHYFIDIEYKIGPGKIGKLRPESTLLGLHGAFKKDIDDKDLKDKVVIEKGMANMNRYYEENRIDKEIDKVDGGITTLVSGEEKGESREPRIDTIEFNRIAGSSKAQSSYMPKLDMVYKPAEADGKLTGYGIYDSGNNGAVDFGFNRNSMTGKITLRYVLKEDTKNPHNIQGVNIYPTFLEISSGVNTETDRVAIPDFLMVELEKLIERSDRAIVDTDLSALMSGRIYNNVGMGILTGYYSQYTNVARNMSTVRRVIARDTEENRYLLEVETVRQEGPSNSRTYGTFRDKSYVVVEQMEDRFIITDSILMTRQLTSEPQINPDSSIAKRLAALNLAGEVEEQHKDAIESLLDDLYKAGTARILEGPQETTIDGKKVELKRGMYDTFNSDTTLLSSDKKEYMNATLRELLVRKGTGTKAEYNGQVTEWIGGADNQAELITEETIIYDKSDNGLYLEVYYLVSKIGGDWVIDDMKIIEQEEKPTEELRSVLGSTQRN